MSIQGVGGSTSDIALPKVEQTNAGQAGEGLKTNTDKNRGIDINRSEIKEKEIDKAIDKLNKFLEDKKTHAEYSVHDKLNDIMIKIVDDKTGDVIQELPPKKVLDMVARMCELVGLIVDDKA